MNFTKLYFKICGFLFPIVLVATGFLWLEYRTQFDLEYWHKGNVSTHTRMVPALCKNQNLQLCWEGRKKQDIVRQFGKPDLDSNNQISYGNYPALSFKISTASTVDSVTCEW